MPAPAKMSPAVARQLTLYVPGLFAGASAPESFRRVLARSDHLPGGAAGDTERLFALFGVSPEAGQDLPVAAVTRVADMGVVDRDWWMRADPVNLEPTRGGLLLQAGLGLEQKEADRLIADLSEALAQEGWLLKAPRPERWYLKPPAAPAITTTPLASVSGRDIHPFLPQGPDHRAWHTHLNEFQILLHTSPVNAAREKRGAPPANSVWFWGGGRLPQPGHSHWAHVSSTEPLSQGLARLSAIPFAAVPADAGNWLAAVQGAGEHLIVLDGPGEPVRPDEASGSLQQLEQHWLMPLLAAVHSGELSALRLLSDTGPLLDYRRRHRWRFWRRPRPLSAYRAA